MPGPYVAKQVTTRFTTPRGLGNHQGRRKGSVPGVRQPNINGPGGGWGANNDQRCGS